MFLITVQLIWKWSVLQLDCEADSKHVDKQPFWSRMHSLLCFMATFLASTKAFLFYFQKEHFRNSVRNKKRKEKQWNKPTSPRCKLLTPFSRQEKQKLMFLTNCEGGASSCATLTMHGSSGESSWCACMCGTLNKSTSVMSSGSVFFLAEALIGCASFSTFTDMRSSRS